MDDWTDGLADRGADRPPGCDWGSERGRCHAAATWQVRCAPRPGATSRGSWPGDVDVVRVCAQHLAALTRERRVLGPPTPLEKGGAG